MLVAAIRRNLDASMRCMYLNSPAMVAGLRSQLYAAGSDLRREMTRGALVLSSDHDHVVDGQFSIDRMLQMLETAVYEALADGYTGLFVTGDMTWEFGSEKNLSKLVDYEWGLEQLFQKLPSLWGICQYHRDLLPRHAVRTGAVAHENVFINATLTRLNPHYVSARSAAEWEAAAHSELEPALDEILALKA